MQSHLRPKTNIEIKTEKNLKKQAILIKKCVCWREIIYVNSSKSTSKAQALRRARWGGSLALELLRLSIPVRPNPPFGGRGPPAKTPFHRTGRHFCSLSNSLWQLMCHRKRILVPPRQGGAKKVSLWQAILHRVHSTPSALPKWIGGSLRNNK